MAGNLTKLDVVRRQLGTALALFIEDKDSVSVHSLACAAGEIAETLAERNGALPFRMHAIETFPHLTDQNIAWARGKYWNAFKHATERRGLERKDDVLLRKFSDEQNDHALFLAWYDYSKAAGCLPLEAQVFEVWYLAKYLEKLADGEPADVIERTFPCLAGLPRAEQKKRLRQAIQRYRKDRELMEHPQTDQAALIGDAV